MRSILKAGTTAEWDKLRFDRNAAVAAFGRLQHDILAHCARVLG